MYTITSLLSLINTAKEEVKKEDMVGGNTILVFDGMLAKVNMMGGKVFHLDEAKLYKMAQGGNKSDITPVKAIENSQVVAPKDYRVRKVIADTYLLGSRNWDDFNRKAGSFYKIGEINAKNNAIRQKHLRQTDAQKITELINTIPVSAYEIDLFDMVLEDKANYVISYEGYYSLDKKKVRFYSDVFKYRKDAEQLQLVDETEVEWYKTWWAVVAAVVGIVLIGGLCLSSCISSKEADETEL